MTNQKDAIIAACKPILEFANDYVEHKVDKIYIHGYNRNDGYSCNFFYGINEKIYSRDEILFVLDFPVEKNEENLNPFSIQCYSIGIKYGSYSQKTTVIFQ